MTIPNIGYKANSIYERDAIFDELEKMGWQVVSRQNRANGLSIERSGNTKYWTACRPDNCDPAETYYPSPESFLAAAREALKPKYPTETLHAKCNSPFELRGCIQALHEAGVPIYEKEGDSSVDWMGLNWDGEEILRYMAQDSCFLNGSRELPLSEFMDIFLRPGKPSEHFMDAAPYLAPRKCMTPLDNVLYWMSQPKREKPWTAEYNEGQSAWVQCNIKGVSKHTLSIDVAGAPILFAITNPKQIRKA